MPRFNVGGHMKAKKLLKEDLVSKNKAVEELNNEIRAKEIEISVKRAKLRRLNEKVDSLVAETEEVDSIRREFGSEEKGQFLSVRAINARKKQPSGINLKSSTSRKRRRETVEAAEEINGGKDGGSYGLVDTVDKAVTAERIVDVIEKAACKNITTKVLPKVYKKSVAEFEKSNDNMIRSVAVYYSRGVMGKKKYRAVYKSNSFKRLKHKHKFKRLTISGCPIPKLVPYHRLTSFITDINIGTLYSVREKLCADLDDKEKIDGVYRNLEELLISICSFYLNNNYDMSNFGDADIFYVALGGDGAPFGKDDTAVAWLVSILNIGQRVLSSSENYLLFGANCNENCLPVRRFVVQLMKDVEKIVKTTYTINLRNGSTRKIRFLISEFPNDMKMLCFLTGELSNSATYFSSFADVALKNLKTESMLSGTFGPEQSNTWKPWKYDDRVRVVKKVEKYKASIAKEKITEATRRSKITKYIAEQHSRQEFYPLIGKYVDSIHVDSLHLKNNACAHAHRYFLDELLNQCSQDIHNYSCFSKLPKTSKFVRYVETMKSKCGLSRLAKRVIKWFEDTKGSKGDSFDYRFTGKDSRMFLFNFMFLIEVLEEGTAGHHYQQRIYGLSLICIYLRDSVSLFTRINITAEKISKLKDLCYTYLRANHVFYSVNPTVWTIGFIVPAHTQNMLDKYGMGLGLNSMEGREAKHQSIAKFSKNTFYHNRWEQIFRHEFVSLIWLRNEGFDLSCTPNHQISYIPKRTDKPLYCDCGFHKDENQTQCKFCSHPMRGKALVSIERGKWIN